MRFHVSMLFCAYVACNYVIYNEKFCTEISNETTCRKNLKYRYENFILNYILLKLSKKTGQSCASSVDITRIYYFWFFIFVVVLLFSFRVAKEIVLKNIHYFEHDSENSDKSLLGSFQRQPDIDLKDIVGMMVDILMAAIDTVRF